MPAAPKETVAHRKPRVGPLVLPAGGRKDPAPAWPLPGGPSEHEQALWGELWATPQAAAWERHGWTRVVARYTRVVLVAELLDKDAMSEARQLEDRLGLTPKAMRLLLWTVSADEVSEKRDQAATDSAAGARGRIKAVG